LPHQEGAGEVHAEGLIPLSERQRFHRAIGCHRRRHVDQCGQPTKCRDGAFHRFFRARLVCNIDSEPVGASASLDHRARRSLSLGRLEIGNRHCSPFGGEAARDRTADLTPHHR